MTSLLTDYFLRVTPGILLMVLFLAILPRKMLEMRLVMYIFCFILFRDAMTPLRIWEFNQNFGIRFVPDPTLVATLGILSGAFVGCIQFAEPELRKFVVWFKGNKTQSIGLALLAGILVALPSMTFQHFLPPSLKASPVPLMMLPSLFLICFIGNFLEEMLFRGYFQGYAETITTPLKAAILSGVFFGVCHVFLAISVTHLGFTVIGFALYEGLIAPYVRMKAGVIASTLTHGLAIFLLSSGIISF